MPLLTRLTLSLTDRGVIPDRLIRHGIRHFVRQRLQEISCKDDQDLAPRKMAFLHEMGRSSIAPSPEKANSQHYEVPTGLWDTPMNFSECGNYNFVIVGGIYGTSH